MRNRVSALVSIAVCSLAAGCSVPTSESVSREWTGRTISEAIRELGPPTSTTSLPDGITIYGWEEQYGSATAVSRATCRKGLHVNSEGVIVEASQLSESLLCD